MAVDVVALRAAGVGDLLTSVPALRALAAQAGPVTLAAPAWLHPLAPLIPGVAGVVDVNGLQPKRPLADAVAINLHGSGPQSHAALLAGGPRDLVAFHCPVVWEYGPAWSIDDDEPERQRFCRLLEWIGIAADPDLVGIKRPAAQPVASDAIVLHVGGTDPARRWPAESFAELARRLRGHPIVVTGGPGEEPLMDAVASATKHGAVSLASAKRDLEGLKELVRGARLLLVGDSGPRWYAAAFDVPCVSVMGPNFPELTASSLELARVVRVEGLECAPCLERVCPLGHHRCMRDLGVEVVLEAARDVLARERRGGMDSIVGAAPRAEPVRA